jgi:hypothetical protein
MSIQTTPRFSCSETRAKRRLVEKLFERFGQDLEGKGYIARGRPDG